jgi:hypothetical protein
MLGTVDFLPLAHHLPSDISKSNRMAEERLGSFFQVSGSYGSIWALSESEGANIRAWESAAYKKAAEYRAVLPSSNETAMALSHLSEEMIRGLGNFSIGNDGINAERASVFRPTVTGGRVA